MPDIASLISTKPYYVNNRSTVGGPLTQYVIDNDPQLVSTASGTSPRSNADILYPIRFGNPMPVSSGFALTSQT